MTHWRDKLTPAETNALRRRVLCAHDSPPVNGDESLVIKLADLLDANEAASRLLTLRAGITPQLEGDD